MFYLYGWNFILGVDLGHYKQPHAVLLDVKVEVVMPGTLPHYRLHKNWLPVASRRDKRNVRIRTALAVHSPDGKRCPLPGGAGKANPTCTNLELSYFDPHLGFSKRPMTSTEPSSPDGKSGFGVAAGMTCKNAQGQGTAALQI